MTTPEYYAWSAMKQRCYNSKAAHYRIYGGRGIEVCSAWRVDFATFLADVGLRPSPIHSLDRIDVNGNYEPTNCRWATPSLQALNRRRGAGFFDVNDRRVSAKAIAAHLAMPRSSFMLAFWRSMESVGHRIVEYPIAEAGR